MSYGIGKTKLMQEHINKALDAGESVIICSSRGYEKLGPAFARDITPKPNDENVKLLEHDDAGQTLRDLDLQSE